MEQTDFTIQSLLEKKKELLASMLKQSAKIRAASTEQQLDIELKDREETLRLLQINDQAISIRNKQLAAMPSRQLAKGESKRLRSEIEALIKGIKYNNQAQILDLEDQMTDLETERKAIERSNRVGGYLKRPQSKRINVTTSRAKRPLPKGGYGQ